MAGSITYGSESSESSSASVRNVSSPRWSRPHRASFGVTSSPSASKIAGGGMWSDVTAGPSRKPIAPSSPMRARSRVSRRQRHSRAPTCRSTVRKCSACLPSTVIVSWPSGVLRLTPRSKRCQVSVDSRSGVSLTVREPRATATPVCSSSTRTSVRRDDGRAAPTRRPSRVLRSGRRAERRTADECGASEQADRGGQSDDERGQQRQASPPSDCQTIPRPRLEDSVPRRQIPLSVEPADAHQNYGGARLDIGARRGSDLRKSAGLSGRNAAPKITRKG